MLLPRKEFELFEFVPELIDLHPFLMQVVIVEVIEETLHLLEGVFDSTKNSSHADVDDECTSNWEAKDKVDEDRESQS